MIILKLIGLVLLALLIYWLVVEINKYTYKEYDYDFFNMHNFVVTAVGYAFLYFGNRWYMSAFKANDDLLNGQILLGIGMSLIIYVIYINIKSTSIILGLFLTLFQLLLYVGLSFIAFFAIIILIAALSETKHVYVLNKY